MSAAVIPDTAAGNTTRMLVERRRAPSPKDASRRACGTACIASSATDATSGVTRSPTAIPAASMLKSGTCDPKSRCTSSGLITRIAKYPRTTLGMLARVSMIGFRYRRARGVAYPDR